VTFFVSHVVILSIAVWRIPNAAGESYAVQGSAGDRARVARKRGSGSGDRENEFLLLDFDRLSSMHNISR
jgi:hypothetical protein